MTSYCGPPADPAALWSRWNLDPVLLAALLAGAFVLRRARHPRPGLAAILVLALVFVSPLCALSVSLFSARALHHLLVVAAAAPLLAMAFPARSAMAFPARSAMPQGLALLLATAVLWLWHLPVFYDAALSSTPLYWLMQITLLGSAFWYWQALLAAPPLAGIIAAILGMAQMGMLGALLTFAPRPLYAAHFGTTQPWGLEQLADQQLAGLVMWVPGILPYAIAVALLARSAWTRAVAAT